MHVTATPQPFNAADGYTITIRGGRPPYAVMAMPHPPNPPGVTVTASGTSAIVNVPPETPRDTPIEIEIRDASDPPRAILSINHTA